MNNGVWIVVQVLTFVKKIENYIDLKNTESRKLNLANQESTEITGKGEVLLNTNYHVQPRDIILNNTLHVPDLRSNLRE